MSVFLCAIARLSSWFRLGRSVFISPGRLPARSKRPLVLAAIIVCCLGLVGTSSVMAQSSDGIALFDTIAGGTTGEFGWDVFNGSRYVGPHTPDQFATGIGSANLTVNSGGFGPTSQGNLYSFMSTAVWDINLTGLEASNLFTSIAIQIAVPESATPGKLTIDSFTLNGQDADDFYLLTQTGLIGGQFGGADTSVDYYWAEWNGLTAGPDFIVSVTGTGQHQSLVAAKASYVNTSDASFDISNVSAIPEPSSAALSLSLLSLALLRRRSNGSR